MKRTWKLAVAVLGGVAMLGGGGIALAQSDGVYTPEDQRCDEEHNDTANQHDPHDNTERCQNATVAIQNGDHELIRVGTLHTEEGTFVHHYQVDGDFGQGVDPTQGLRIYFGADDNLAGGEHDGASGMGNGPSDGGGIELLLELTSYEAWVDAIQNGDTAYLQANPIPFVSFAIGSCADGICESATTHRRIAYQSQKAENGEDPDTTRDAADQNGQVADPEDCAGPSQGPEDCDDPTTPDEQEDIHYWDDQVGTVYLQPGVQIYQDPNPEGSPILPSPIPSAYVGTCGAYANGGAMIPTGAIDARYGC
ncbi:MAG: hypothetical protein ACT452_08350 [Microthrixaceae bacterium]